MTDSRTLADRLDEIADPNFPGTVGYTAAQDLRAAAALLRGLAGVRDVAVAQRDAFAADLTACAERALTAEAERDAAVARADTATVTTTYWRDAMMEADGVLRGAAHPLAMVLAALGGETDPAMLGIDPDSDAAALLDRGTDR